MPLSKEERDAKYAELPKIMKEREHIIREQWVKVMEARIVREELNKCQRTEGVNGYENCKEWADRYIALLKVAKVTGWRTVDTE